MTRLGIAHGWLRELTGGFVETLADFRNFWRGPRSSPSQTDTARMPRTIAQRQFRGVVRETPANLAATAFAAVLWFLAFRAMGASSYLAWCALGLVALAYVTLLYIGFQHASPSDDELGRWETRFQSGMLLSGLVWGSASLVPAPPHALPYIAMGTLLMMAGGVSLFATYRPGISLYATPIQVITSASLIAGGEPLGVATGVGFAVAVGLMIRLARVHNTSITKAMLVAEERKALLDELAVQRREAERASLAKTFVLASVSHDLRQPLNSIGLLVDAARRGGKADDDIVEQISASVRSMDDLLGALLEISRLDSGAAPLQIKSFAIADVLERVRLQFDPQSCAKGLSLDIQAPDMRVQSDFFQLERMLANLVANAVRYTATGGIRIRCRRRSTTLWMQVWDSGIGIARKDRARVFDEFFQVARTARSGKQGMGLGLTIVQRSAQRLNHAVRVRSRPGRGTMFEIGVPIAFAAENEAGLARLAQLLDGRLVLLIDDDPMCLKGMTALLTTFNCQVLSAGSLPDALTAVDECLRLPDLIVSDFQLGDGYTGLDAVNRVRTLAQEDMAAVLVTAHPQAARHAADIPVLAKPLRPEALAVALGSLPKY